MKVKELIEQLQKLNPETYIVCYSGDEELRSFRGPISIFEINDASETRAELGRSKAGVPMLKFEDTEKATSIALIEITSDC